MIAVVHLVWGPLGPAPLRDFLASYRAHPAGTEHELVVLFNGVTPERRPPLLAALEQVEHRVLELPEPVQDLVAYAQAVERLEHEHLCFLNSYSAILAPNWLAMLERALRQSRAGLVGATGSWASMSSLMLHSLGLPNSYRGAVPDRRTGFEQFQAIKLELDGEGELGRAEQVSGAEHVADDGGQLQGRSRRATLLGLARDAPSMVEQLLWFEGFPAPHLRTNAFMARRAVLGSVRFDGIHNKMNAYRLESGRKGLTRQIEALGLRPLVVDRDGVAHEHRDWPRSHTFWQGDQEGLLVADNQTRIYANGDLVRRELLSGLAWGSRAELGSWHPARVIG
ncbi:MAG TPA: hypothetical protein VIJ33_01910 [Solirubrobacteraceae bacterium]